MHFKRLALLLISASLLSGCQIGAGELSSGETPFPVSLESETASKSETEKEGVGCFADESTWESAMKEKPTHYTTTWNWGNGKGTSILTENAYYNYLEGLEQQHVDVYWELTGDTLSIYQYNPSLDVWEKTWASNESCHWHPLTCGCKGDLYVNDVPGYDFGGHTFDSTGECSVCGYQD